MCIRYTCSRNLLSHGVFNFEMNRVGPGVEEEGPYINKPLNIRNIYYMLKFVICNIRKTRSDHEYVQK